MPKEESDINRGSKENRGAGWDAGKQGKMGLKSCVETKLWNTGIVGSITSPTPEKCMLQLWYPAPLNVTVLEDRAFGEAIKLK